MTNKNSEDWDKFLASYRENDLQRGFSKREYFAGLAMQGILASGLHGSTNYYAKRAVQCADALLRELQKEETAE